MYKFATRIDGKSIKDVDNTKPYYPIDMLHILHETENLCLYQNENGYWFYDDTNKTISKIKPELIYRVLNSINSAYEEYDNRAVSM